MYGNAAGGCFCTEQMADNGAGKEGDPKGGGTACGEGIDGVIFHKQHAVHGKGCEWNGKLLNINPSPFLGIVPGCQQQGDSGGNTGCHIQISGVGPQAQGNPVGHGNA